MTTSARTGHTWSAHARVLGVTVGVIAASTGVLTLAVVSAIDAVAGQAGPMRWTVWVILAVAAVCLGVGDVIGNAVRHQRHLVRTRQQTAVQAVHSGVRLVAVHMVLTAAVVYACTHPGSLPIGPFGAQR